jgi:hypothetical protein
MPSTIVWNSQLVQQSLEKLRMGIYTPLDCFHYGNIELKAGNILYQLTSEEIDEFHKCSDNIIYFVEKYCRFLTDKGRTVVKLREKQKLILTSLAKESYNEKFKELIPDIRNLIMMQSRQSGKTTTICAYFAWYLCFHVDRNLAILANRQNTAYEIVSKVTDVFKGLPFFLKPGIIRIGAGGMALDNKCQLFSQATTKTAQIGFTIHVLYADEFAHIQPHIADDFWRSAYPTLASSEISQCIISSTPAGEENIFYEIWDKAIKEQNSFMPIRVDYWEVPDHDTEWAEKMKKDFGEERFAQEFELLFNHGDSNLLLSANDLNFISKIKKEYVFHELTNSELDESVYRNLKWHPNFDPNAKFNNKNDRFIISIDTGEGRDEDEVKDNDYNIANIFKVEPRSLPQLKKLRKDEYRIKNMFKITQIGIYRDNIKDEENCAKVTKAVIFDQLGAERCKLVVEMNFNGKFFLGKFAEHDDYFIEMILHTYHTKPIPGDKLPRRRKSGFKVTGGDKDFFCKLGKQMISKKILILNEIETSKEFKAFGRNRRGKYKGIGVHDDIAMSALNISRLYNESEYEDWLYDFFDTLEDNAVKKLMSELLEKYIETSEITDEEFSTLYKESEIESEQDRIMKIFNEQNNKPRFPGMSSIPTNKNIFNIPWRKS